MIKTVFKILPVIILLLPALTSICRAEEQITITTYYPAPNGIYRELRADQMAVGSVYRAAAISDGILIVSGNIGVGTATPASKLHVQGGDIKIRSTANPAVRFQHDAADDTTWASVYRESATGRLFVRNDQGNDIILSNADVSVPEGNMYTNGLVYVDTSATNPGGCLMMSYGSNTGTITCPPGFTIDTILSGAASPTGGFLFCCQ